MLKRLINLFKGRTPESIGDTKKQLDCTKPTEIKDELTVEFVTNEITNKIEEVNNYIDLLIDMSKEAVGANEQILNGIAQTSIQFKRTAKKIENEFDNLATVNSVIQDSTHQLNELVSSSNTLKKSTVENVFSAKDNMLSHIDEIEKTFIKMLNLFNNLEEQISQLSGIVSGIENIASQTRLLSLNARIESSRAGEAGRAFGVVASEIQKLSDQSEVYTKDIKVILENLSDTFQQNVDAVKLEVSQGNKAKDSISTNLTSIIEYIEQFVTSIMGTLETANNSSQENTRILSESIASLNTHVKFILEQTLAINQICDLCGLQANKVQLYNELAVNLAQLLHDDKFQEEYFTKSFVKQN